MPKIRRFEVQVATVVTVHEVDGPDRKMVSSFTGVGSAKGDACAAPVYAREAISQAAQAAEHHMPALLQITTGKDLNDE